MNMHMPQSIITETELRHLAAIPYQIINPGSNKPIIGIFQDSLLGSFRFTRKDITFTALEAMDLLMTFPHVNVDEIRKLGNEITSFDIISQIMPPLTLKYKTALFDDNEDAKTSNNMLEIRAGKYVRGQMEKGVFDAATKGILHRICNDHGNMACSDFNDNMQNIVTEYMKTSSFSVGISDLIADRKTYEEISECIKQQKMEVQTILDKVHLGIFENNTANTNMVQFELMVSNILNKATDNAGKIGKKSLSKDNRFLMIVNSGSKGSLINISQMISCLGQQSVDGKRIAYGLDDRTLPHFKKYDDSPTARGFVENSYITGLNAPELFFHAMAGRTGLIDTAVKSVTRETTIIILEDGRPKYTEIGAWIDAQLDATENKKHVEHSPNDRNLELLNLPLDKVYIPTGDENGTVTWGEVTAITRHDPGERLYEVTTQSGRKVTVAESQSLLIWDEETSKFVPKHSTLVQVGDSVPVTMNLCKSPIVLDHVLLSDYLPKTEYVYGTEFNRAIQMMECAMETRKEIPNVGSQKPAYKQIPRGWWKEHNGKSFVLPYTKKSSLQRTSVRSRTDHIQDGFVYPYHSHREVAPIADTFALTKENGIFLGLFLADGHSADGHHITITKNNENIRAFVRAWFTKHGIVYRERVRHIDHENGIKGTTTTITGTCSVLAQFLDKWVGHGAANKYVPTEAFVANDEFVKGILNGYISGDGSVSERGSITATSVSYRLIEGISMLCSRFGMFGKITQRQHKPNNATQNPLPITTLSIRAQWGKIFADNITLLENNKNDRLQSVKWVLNHRNYTSYNDVVLDPIVNIHITGVEKHPKLYDLTIPSTLNFGLTNGLICRDTSQTGYIQRRLVKGLEDLYITYDMTVRNNKGKIIQFEYGDDNFDSTKVENQILPLAEMSLEDIYMHYDLPGLSEAENNLRMSIFTKPTISRMNKQRVQCKETCHKYIERFIEARDLLIKNVFNNQNEKSVRVPVAFQYIIANIHGQLHLDENSAVDITPLECFQMVEQYYQRMSSIPCVKINRLFEMIYYYYLNPRDLLVKRRFHQKGLELLLETILLKFKEALVHPGEMVGVVAAQSIGEPSTQLTLNSIIWSEKIILRNKIGCIKVRTIGEFIEDQIKKSQKIEYMEDKDTTYAELSNEDEFYEVPCATESGETVWRRVEAVTQHPVVNEDGTNTMLKITTKGCREVTATKAKSFLQLIDGKIQGVNGKDLKVGDYLPVSRKVLDYQEIHTFSLREFLSPSEYLYGSELKKASLVRHETQWWKNHANKTFFVPHKTRQGLWELFRENVQEGKTPFKYLYIQPGNVYTKSMGCCSYNIPETMELTYDFGYLVGAYAAEGCGKKNGVSICNNSDEYLLPIERICKQWNITTSKRKRTNRGGEGWTSQELGIHNTIVACMLEHLCGTMSYNKFVSPTIVFSNRECILGFLDAYIGGDGSVSKHINQNGTERINNIHMWSTSTTLLTDVMVMLKNVGVSSHIATIAERKPSERAIQHRRPSYSLNVKNRQAYKLAKLLHLTVPEKQERLNQLLEQTYYKYEYSLEDMSLPNIIQGELVMEERKERMMDLEFDQIVSIEEVPNPTKYAYDLTVEDTRNFDLYNGLCMLDTFHHTGVSSKTNVTRGVPRIEEILRLTKNPKNPSMTVFLHPLDEAHNEKANTYAMKITHTKLVDVVKNVQICFDPMVQATQIEDDQLLLEQFYQFEQMVEECIAAPERKTDEPVKSKWIIRMEIDKETLVDKNISMDDIHFAIANSDYGKEIQCIFSDFNTEKLVFRIRKNANIFDKKTGKRGVPNPLDQSDDIYLLKNFQDTLLNQIVLRGVNGVQNVLPRKLQNIIVKVEDKYIKKDTWVMDTTGSNLLDTLALDYIDSTRTYSNDIKEVFNVLGIEAARQCIHNELVEVMAFAGASINYHHTSLLCDRMTCNKDMVSIFRSGLLNDNVGPIAKATFEVHTEVFLTAARHAEFDHMRGVSANIMCGQQGTYGTNAFQIVLDMKAYEGIQNVDYGRRNVSQEIEKGMSQGQTDELSCTQIEIQNNIVNVKRMNENVSVCYDDGYEVGF
jgi:DNA-directed RNA polymerase beta' subunit